MGLRFANSLFDFNREGFGRMPLSLCLNARLSGTEMKSVTVPAQIVLFFELNGDWNVSGGLNRCSNGKDIAEPLGWYSLMAIRRSQCRLDYKPCAWTPDTCPPLPAWRNAKMSFPRSTISASKRDGTISTPRSVPRRSRGL